MFGPQGTGFFLLLMVVFGGLLVWVALAKQVVFRVLAACLAFLPAMVFGIAAVNKFYDYYQTWGGMINDLTGQGASTIPKYAAAGSRLQQEFRQEYRPGHQRRGRRPSRIPVPDLGHRRAQPPYP